MLIILPVQEKSLPLHCQKEKRQNIIQQFKTLQGIGQLLIRDMKIENLVNARGNKVANQIKVTTNDETYFQSYNSVVASIDRRTGKVQLYKDWDYSNTTRKYLYKFLGEYGYKELNNKKAVEAAIKQGEVSYIEDSPSL